MSSLERLWAGWRSEYIEQAVASDDNDCVFCAILASDHPDGETFVVWRHSTDLAAAVLNAYPYTSGHLMVLPSRHVGDIEQLDATESAAVWQGVVEAVQALKAAYHPDG